MWVRNVDSGVVIVKGNREDVVSNKRVVSVSRTDMIGFTDH
jgi:hypothetical protein